MTYSIAIILWDLFDGAIPNQHLPELSVIPRHGEEQPADASGCDPSPGKMFSCNLHLLQIVLS